jgi:hypothetical protein
MGGSRGGDGWRLEVKGNSIALLSAAARAHAPAADPGNSLPAASDVDGSWETSGVIDAERFLGRGAWLLDVQAHGLVIQPSAETVEGGQVLMLAYEPKGKP